jgi:hypothetical protein
MFVSEDSSQVRPELMPDFLHPNAAGTELMGKCIRMHVRNLLRL